MKPKGTSRLFTGSTALIVASFVTTSAFAASATWNGTTGTAWSATTNWSGPPATAPGAGDTATFNNAGNANTTLDLGSGVTIGGIVFDTATAAPYTLGTGAVGSQSLTFGSPGTVSLSSTVTANQLVNANLILSNAAAAATTITNNSAGSLTIAGGIAANVASGNGVITVAGTGNTLVSGTITKPGAGSNALLKTGSGTLTLSNGSVWSGAGTAGFPLVAREGTLLLNGGIHTVNGELVVGGVVTNGGAGQNAKIQLDAGTLAVSSWLSIGRGNGVGAVSSDIVANNAGIITAANFSAGFNGGTATNLPKGSFTLNNTSSFTISGDGAFNLAESPGSQMTMTLNNSAQVTAAGTGIKRIGNNGTGVLNINDTASVNFGNQAVYLGYRTGTGTVNMTGGTFTTAGEVRVGGSDTNGADTATGTLNVSGGTANLNTLVLGRGNNNAALVNGTATFSGGTVNVANDAVLGFAGANNLGKLTVSGATLNVGTAGLRWMIVGRYDTTRSELNISSGSINLLNSTAIKMIADGTLGASVVNQTGGTVAFYSDGGTTLGGGGNLDLQRAGGATSSTYNLSGGTLAVPQVISSSTAGARTFNFNGGTLKAVATQASFFNLGSGATANVRDGGVKIDTNGFNVTVAQALVHSTIGGDAATDGGLTKQSPGTLTLNGENTYTGATLVSGGTLDLGTGSINNSPSVTVNGSGAKLLQSYSSGLISPPVTLTQGAVDANGTISTLTVANSVGNTLSVGNGSGGLLLVDTLTFQGAATVNVVVAGAQAIQNIQATALSTNAAGQIVVNASNSSGFWAPGNYPVISYTSFTGDLAHFTLAPITGLGAGQAASLVNVDGAISLHITGDSLTWTGNQNSNWTAAAVGGPINWKSGEIPTTYTNGSPVLFNEAGNLSVNLTSNVSPSTTIFDNADPNTFIVSSTGGFGISGGPLLKSNTGTLVLTTTNTTTGIITITGGILQIGDGTTDGSIAASASIVNNAALNYQTAGSQTLTNPISGTGVTTMTGTGTLTLAGANNFTGGGIGLASGTLNVNHPSAIGSTTGGSLTISGGILNNTSGAAITTTTAKAQTWSGDFTFTGSNNLNFNGGTVTVFGGGSRVVNLAAGTLGTGNIIGNATGTGLSLTGPGLLAITSGTASNLGGPLDVAAGSKLRMNTGADAATTSDFVAIGLTGNGTVENGGGVERWFFANPYDDQTFPGLLQNGGVGPLGFNKGGAGTLTLTGANTYTGRTSITAGTISVATISNAGLPGPLGAGAADPAAIYLGNNGGTGILLYTGADVTLDRGFTTGANDGNSGVIDTNANMTFTGAVNGVNAGGFIKRGTGTLTLSNSSATQKLSNGANGGASVFGVNVALGKLVLKNGTFAAAGEIVVGGQLQTAGAYQASSLDVTNSGALTTANWISIGRGNGTTTDGLSSVLTVDGGKLSQTNAGNGLAMGYNAGVAGFKCAPVLNILGASTLDVAGSLKVGESSGSDATLNVQGTSTVNLTNGNLASKTIGAEGKGTLNLTAGTVNAGGGLTIGQSATGEGHVHLDGGLLDTGTLAGGAGTSYLHLNGGTLRANADTATFVTGITNAEINAAGFTVDTLNHVIAIPQALIKGTGTGGLTQTGAGSLTLAGINTYVGNTTVSAGALILADNAGLKFAPAANGVSNKVTGVGSASFDGDFTIDTAGATLANGNSWTLVDTTTKAFTTNFTVVGFDDADLDNKWTKVEGANTWTFDEATGALTLAVSSGTGYATWAAGFGLPAGDQDPTDDPDHDGFSNLSEYVLGGNPSQSSTAIAPAGQKVGSNFVFTFKRSDISEADTTQFVEYGDNLTVWGSYSIGASPGTGAVSISENTPTADFDTVTVTIPTAGATKFFARLKVVK